MKTMTEFIMEQEAPQVEVVEESFNEADLVSQFMALQAASANMSCVMEYAAIAEFCNKNEINMPESLVQEGFRDVMDKVFEAISNFFQKIADWFKSLVKGASSAFSKSKISDCIAKLETGKFETEELPADIADKLKYINATYEIVWNFFIEFKTVLQEYGDLADGEPAENDYINLINNIDTYTNDLEVFKKESKWYRGGDGSVDFSAFKNINKNNVAEAKYENITRADAIKILKNINKYNIPSKGEALLKEIGVTEKKFAGFKKGAVPEIGPDGKPTGQKVSGWVLDSSKANAIKTKITKCSNALASAYEKVTGKLIELYGKNLKDVEAPSSDKESKEAYNKSVEASKKVAGTGQLGKDAKEAAKL